MQVTNGTNGKGLEARIQRGIANRGAFKFLATATLTLAISLGVLARWTAPDDFHSYSDALWWSLATLTTVGYGDVVPVSAWGRMLGVGVMVLGVTFLSFLTATVTSLFVSADERGRAEARAEAERDAAAALQRIEERLAAIESRLEQGR